MQDSSWNWQKTSIWATVLVLCLLVALPVLEFTKPGSVICPLRRMAKKVGLPVGGLDELLVANVSAEDEEWAKSMAIKWKQAALKQYPNLQVEAHPVAEAENGFWQMSELENFRPRPTAELADIQRELSTLDTAKAQEELSKNKAWVDRVEWLASLDKTSSVDLPSGPVAFISVAPCKQAHDTLMLKALLAAKSGDEVETLRCIRAGARLSEHMFKVETPTLLTETVSVLCHLSRVSLIMEKILPALGPNADLKQWQREINREQFTPQRLATAIRGEWQVGSEIMAYPAFAIAHRQRMLTDPERVAMTHAMLISKEVAALNAMTLASMATPRPSPTLPKRLSPEGREFIDLVWGGSDAWTRGYVRSARVQQCHLAAVELLALERAGEKLQAHDTKRVTLDPITGSPFIIDPATRELTMPPGYPEFDLHEPLKLPW